MTQTVPVAAQSPLALHLLVLAVPLLRLGTALLEGGPGGWATLPLALVLLAVFVVAPRRLADALTPAGQTEGGLGVRTFGTQLPPACAGQFTGGHRACGPGHRRRVRAAASRTRGGVLVESGGAAYFLTPADPATFLQILRERSAEVSA